MKLMTYCRWTAFRNTVAAVFVSCAVLGTGAFADPVKDDPKDRSSAKERTGDKAGTRGDSYGGQQNAGSQDTQAQPDDDREKRREHRRDHRDDGYTTAAGSYPNDESYRSQHDSADDRKLCEPKTKEKAAKICKAKPTTTEIEPRVPQGQPAR